MRIDSIPAVGEKAAQSLYEEGSFHTAEAVAYAYGPDVVACDGIDASIYLNAQELVAEMSDLSNQKSLSNENYWCTACSDEGNPFGSSPKFSNERACTTHMQQCSQCPPGYGDVGYRG